MRYSLCSRFRGTFLGVAVGEMLGKSTSGVTASVMADCQWEHLAVVGTKSLIRLGRFDVDDWRDALGKDWIISLLRSSSDAQNAMNCVSTAIIPALPLALFYHENEIKLRQNLQQLLPWQDNPVNRDGALAVGYAIAQSLTEKLNRTTLIPQIIAFLESQSQVARNLAQVQMLLEQGAGLERTVTELRQADASASTTIALAFYCFLSTLEDFRLSVMRAAQKSYQPEITSAITGALSGAYNSTSGIPATMRMALKRSNTKPLAAWGMTTEAEMLELADSLLVVWSGMYDQETQPSDLALVAAIAAPRVIRPR